MCRDMCERFYTKCTVRTDFDRSDGEGHSILHALTHGFLPRNGNNDHKQPRSFPFCPARSNTVKTPQVFSNITLIPRTAGYSGIDRIYKY